MNRVEIIQLRLFNHRLSANYFEKPGDVVAHFGAMQAQDYFMALWAVGLRMKEPDRSAIENLINSGEIIRTHVLRPTWHLVHNKDIRWMMELSAPHVKKAMQYVNKSVGLTDELFLKSWKIIEKISNTDSLSKEDIISCLSEQKMVVNNLLATQIIIRAELEMLLCNGTEKGSYTLFEKRVPSTAKISKTEAITKLAQLYFNSRGPATVKDFAWWSGLSMNDAKTGVAELGKQLESFTSNQIKYYYTGFNGFNLKQSINALLPRYDEYTVSYSESRNIVLPVDLDYSIIGNGIFKPIILYNNEIAGTWEKGKKGPLVSIQTFSENSKIPEINIKESIRKFNLFAG